MSLLSDSYISFVNLDHRTDRIDHITKELSRVGIQAERTRGIYPHEFDVNDLRHQVMRKRTIGAIGCYQSQLNVMKKALELNKHAFVLEDDCWFCDDFLERIDYIDKWYHSIGSLRGHRQFDVIWLGGTFHVGGKGPYWHTHDLGRDAQLTDDPRIIRTFGAFSTHCYIVHKDSLVKVIHQLEEWMSKSMGIDWSFIQMEPFLNTYSFVPGCVKQIDNISDQVPGANTITRFSKFEKLNGTIENSRYWWQPLMSDFDPTTFDWAEARNK